MPVAYSNPQTPCGFDSTGCEEAIQDPGYFIDNHLLQNHEPLQKLSEGKVVCDNDDSSKSKSLDWSLSSNFKDRIKECLYECRSKINPKTKRRNRIFI